MAVLSDLLGIRHFTTSNGSTVRSDFLRAVAVRLGVPEPERLKKDPLLDGEVVERPGGGGGEAVLDEGEVLQLRVVGGEQVRVEGRPEEVAGGEVVSGGDLVGAEGVGGGAGKGNCGGGAGARDDDDRCPGGCVLAAGVEVVGDVVAGARDGAAASLLEEHPASRRRGGGGGRRWARRRGAGTGAPDGAGRGRASARGRARGSARRCAKIAKGLFGRVEGSQPVKCGRPVEEEEAPRWAAYRRAVGDRVRDTRLRANYIQERLAHGTGLSRSTLQSIEKGDPAAPRLGALWRVADVLGVRVHDLLCDDTPTRVDSPGST